MEQFVKHPKYPWYEVGDQGTIRRWYEHTLIKAYNNNGYLYSRIMIQRAYDTGGAKYKNLYVHRLVADTFIPNPNNLPEVNHLDGNKANNSVPNLEWSTHKDNIQHTYDVLGRKTPTGKDHWNYGKTLSAATKALQSAAKLGDKHPRFKGYYVMPDGTKYGSSYEAARAIGKNYRTIQRWCSGSKHSYSFIKC